MTDIESDMSLTREFVERLKEWPANSNRLMARCRQLLIDGLAVGSAGAAEPGPSMMASLVSEDGCTGACSLIGKTQRASVTAAARVNGMAMHVLDFEPMWSPPNHAVSPLLPALLALAEIAESSSTSYQGAALLRAFAKGIEAQGRLRLSSRQFEPGHLKLHPPGLVGPIATALACADFLQLTLEQTTMAVGIAASRTGGLMANIGSHTKALHCGDAAAHGVESALLARRGFLADPDALGGPRGWGHAFFADGFDTTPLLAPLDTGRAIDPGPAWKLFPSQYATHFVITAALDARLQTGALEAHQIARVVLHVPYMPYIDRSHPHTGLDGKFSWQYTTAIALLDGRVDQASFKDKRRFSDDVAGLLDRMELIPDTTISGRLDQMHIDLTLHLTDGRTIVTRCDAPLGSWRRPVEDEMVDGKARQLLASTLSPDRFTQFHQAATRPLENLSITALLTPLSPISEMLE
jgi:aconitate decarboxylase